jgi:Cu/Ag efflux protein CusF
MRVLHRLAWIGILGIALALGASACSGDSQDGHGTGVVKEVDLTARQVTLDHGDIPGVMKGMTMTFHVAPDVRLEDVAPGAEVDFRVRVEGGVHTVTELRRSGS